MVVALRLLLLSFGLAVALAACAEAPSEKKEPAYGQPMLLETDPAALVAETPRGPVRITVEVAGDSFPETMTLASSFQQSNWILFVLLPCQHFHVVPNSFFVFVE